MPQASNTGAFPGERQGWDAVQSLVTLLGGKMDPSMFQVLNSSGSVGAMVLPHKLCSKSSFLCIPRSQSCSPERTTHKIDHHTHSNACLQALEIACIGPRSICKPQAPRRALADNLEI